MKRVEPSSRRARRHQAGRIPFVLALSLIPLTSFNAGLRAESVLEASYQLTAGWNFIRIPFEPLVKDPHTALAAIGWESLWTWVPSATREGSGRWVAAHRDAPPFLNTLQEIPGPGSYGLLMKSAGSLKLKGRWRSERSGLRGGQFQLFSPRVPDAPPTLTGYFFRPGVKEKVGAVYEHAGGAYRKVGDGDPLRADAAYWVLPAQDVPAPDPLRIGAGFGGLRFDAQTTVQEIEIDVGSSPEERTIGLRAIPSAGATGTTDWLEVLGPDGDYLPVGTGISLVVPAEASLLRVTLRARKSGLAASGVTGLAAVIEVSSSVGRAFVGAELEVPTLRGIWTGEARLTEVERPSFHGGGYTPAPTLAVALIFEVPSAGRPRLLPCAEVTVDRDGRELHHTMQAALFPDAIELLGTLGSNGTIGVLRATVSLDPAHPLNPYRHRYTPEHIDGYALTRSVTLKFGVLPPGSPSDLSPFATVGVLGGTYEEEIHGLSKEPIRVRGAFRLRRLAEGVAAGCAALGR